VNQDGGVHVTYVRDGSGAGVGPQVVRRGCCGGVRPPQGGAARVGAPGGGGCGRGGGGSRPAARAPGPEPPRPRQVRTTLRDLNAVLFEVDFFSREFSSSCVGFSLLQAIT